MDDEEIKFACDYPEWIPDGQYRAICTRYSNLTSYKGTRKIFLNFELLSDHYRGTKIFMALNISWAGIRPGSKYFKYWVAANENKRPSRNAIMSPRIFRGKQFIVFTRTVKPKRGPEEMPFDFWYSVVDHLEPIDSPDNEQGLRT
jgi:hypothetical protein